MQLGSSGYSWDVVNGLQNTGPVGTDGQPLTSKTPNRDRFKTHGGSGVRFKIFCGGLIAAVLMAVLLHWFVPAGAVAAGVLYWLYWSSNVGEELYCELDPVTGNLYPVDDRAKLLFQYEDYEKPFWDKENRLMDILVSAKTMPPEMNDTTVNWKCVEFDDAKTVFEIRMQPVNGAVAFFQKNLHDIAAMFGDPDRWEFHKMRDDEKSPEDAQADIAGGWTAWQLTVYELPKNIKSGVAWE